MLDKKQLSDIGFSYVIEKLEPCSPLGNELKRRAAPYTECGREALLLELENTGLLYDALKTDRESFYPLERALMQLKDIRRSVANSRSMTLSEVELFEVKRFLILLEGLEKVCAALPVIEKLNEIRIFSVKEALDILDPDGMRAQTFRLSDNCSDELREIRRERKRVDTELRAIDKKNCTERDRLSADRTLLAAREENEEMRLRSIMTKQFSEYAQTLENLIESIARLDLALAKAKLMLAEGGTIPVIVSADDAHIEFENMVNPMLRSILRGNGRRFTPVSIALSKGSAVITGANMGGKSVVIKMLALNTYLALCGFPVFAERASLPLLSEIHLLCEDREDSRGGLSSFGGEMISFRAILDSVAKTHNGLVLLDEFARGTNPSEGSALVRGAVRYFNAHTNTFAIITTHFDDVACLASRHYQVLGLKNADVSALEAALSEACTRDGGDNASELLSRFMDYGLLLAGNTDNPPRDALKICRALRIPSEFMDYVDG